MGSNQGSLMTDDQENYEERAAIMEYEGGLTRDQAEREARRIVYGYKE